MIFKLDGKWSIKDDDGEFEFIGNVPGTVQGDLVVLGIMPHPYIGTNEKFFERLEKKSWIYTKKFNLDEIKPNLKYDIVFEGIDTLSNVYLNGQLVGTTEDMFLEYRFGAKDVLKKGENILRVEIRSPVKEPRILEKNYAKLAASGESSRPYIRKAQYSYGWDWGARLATSGIWKSVYIESYPDARLIGCTAYLEDLNGVIRVSGYVDSIGQDEQIDSYSVEVQMDGEKVGEFPLSKSVNGIRFNGRFVKEGIELWFPNSMGKSVLHDFEFKLLKEDELVYSERKKIGLRTVKVVRESDDEGETFIFEINGKRVFAKGANWIPAENILSWIGESDYNKLLSMAKEANMNMLRVWGGGIYENDSFYSKCDEMGIMVWQDFMFACAEYPDHLEWFRNLANKEVRANIIKFRHHSSIVLWCGNNENNWGFDEWENFAHKVDGEFLGNKLYLHDFPKICADEDPSRPYWPSSPYGGSKPNSQDSGDRHVWNIWSGWMDYKEYLNDKGKFISEFGFQSAPDLKTIEFFAKGEKKNIFSEVMLNHNKQIEGPERIMKFINAKFGLVNDFDSICYLSQINQAEAMKTGVEHWRIRKYKTAGTLYWQLNDSWPVFSWSAIDYFKRPKALYYYTRRFYSPMIPLVKMDDREIKFVIVNDSDLKTVDMEVEIWSFETGKVFEKRYNNLRIPQDSVTLVDAVRIDKNILSKSIAFTRITFNGEVVENGEMFANLRNVTLPDPKISYERDGDTLKIRCKNPAYVVTIRTQKDVVLSDNFFSLSPSMEKTVKNVKGDFELLSMYDYQKENFDSLSK